MDLSDWLGIAGVASIIAVGATGSLVSYYNSRRAGKQKIAEARLEWNENARRLNIRLYNLLDQAGQTDLSPEQVSEIKSISVELLLMINPDSGMEREAEHQMDVSLSNRLARIGIKIDKEFIHIHRQVLKGAWKAAKSEF